MEIMNNLQRHSGQQTQLTSSPESEARSELIRQQYGDEMSFIETFSTDAQKEVGHNPKLCFARTTPALSELNSTYDESTAATWITIQLADLSEYCGCREKLTGGALEQCAEMIVASYSYLTVAEMLLFFFRFKSGAYGRFYGAVDPMKIMSSLREFVNEERANAINKMESEKGERERAEWAKNAITYEQYLKNHPSNSNMGLLLAQYAPKKPPK